MEKITRADLLKQGATGLTILTMAGCVPDRRLAQPTKPEIAPSLIRYKEANRIPTGLQWARGLAEHQGDVWVVGDMEARCIKANGVSADLERFAGATQAVAVASDGKVFVATSDSITPLGEKTWPSLGPRARFVSLVATENEVAAADAGNRQVVRYDRTGHEIGRLEGFIVPSPYFGLAQHDGDLLVANPGRHRVERYRDGKLVSTIGEQGQEIERFCGCCNPTNLIVMPNGDLVCSEKGIPRVKVLSPSGALKAVVVTPASLNPHSAGLALAIQKPKILVLDPWEGAIRVFEPI